MMLRKWIALRLARIFTREDEQDVERKSFYDSLYAGRFVPSEADEEGSDPARKGPLGGLQGTVAVTLDE
ncbi:MAG: hypothetical protein WBX25_21750 [Rhodomicrobium sp.]